MNWQIFENQVVIGSIGWTLLHSLWQISLIALVLFGSLQILKNASANWRYLFSISALILALIMPLTTFISLSSNKKIETENSITQLNKSVLNSSLSPIKKNLEYFNYTSTEKVKINDEKSSMMLTTWQAQAQEIFTNFLPYLVWLWLFGILVFSLRLSGGLWQTHKLKTRQNSLVDNYWENRFDVLCQTVGIYKPIKFLQSELVKTPMVIGWLKPFVIVPASVLTGLNPHELETIIAHELIHIRRHDYLINTLQSFIEIILFYHPVVWWISGKVRGERENACDDEVLKIFDKTPLLYANALANLEDFRSQSSNLLPPNVLAANGGSLMLRIQRIINNAQMRNSKGTIWASGLAFLLTSVISISLFSVNWNGSFHNNNDVTTKMDAKRVAIAVYSNSQYLIIENIEDADETMLLLTNNLKRRKIPVVGYTAYSGNVRVDDKKAREEKIVALWREAGFEIGYSNQKFPKSYNAKIEDYQSIYQNKPSFPSSDSILMKKMRDQVDYYRKKYGDITNLSAEDKEKLKQEMLESMKLSQDNERKWLKENNLQTAKFTINSVDWMYSNIYDSARSSNDKKLMNYVQDRYIEYLSKIFDYYENTSQQMFNRQIPQTFSLEPSRLVTDSTDKIFEMLKKRGYEFISMDEALKDEVFQLNVNSYGSKSSFFDSVSFLKQGKSIEKPKPDQDIMTSWYEKDSKY